jgi:hypothetical protein
MCCILIVLVVEFTLSFVPDLTLCVVCSEEDIPFIPSPGMTEEQENALKGTEVKENISPEGILPSEPEKRKLAGILQPSTDFPCDLQDDPALQQV